MSDVAVKVQGLSKKYRIGQRERYKALRDILTQALYRPFRSVTSAIKGKPAQKGALSGDGYFWALRDISFEVKHGEVIGIIGRNGAGKTTLLKIISRITEPTQGTVDIYGRVGSLLEVGTGFHPELTGRENIYLNGAILGMRKTEIERKFDEIIDFAEIEKFIDTPVKFYSSGMYMRLAFSVAAHLEPEILLVDEVLAVGDAEFQKKCLGKMGDVSRQGRTVLFVSHNMSAIRKLCPGTILLNMGSIVMAGPTESVIARYLLDSTSSLLAEVELPPGDPNAFGEAKRLRFFNQNGKPHSQFNLNESWKIELEFNLTSLVTHVIAGVGVVTSDEIPVITYWSKPGDLQAGRYCVEFECNLPLKACELQFAVGLSSHEQAFYYKDHVGHVSISEVLQGGEQPFRASGSGLLLNSTLPEVRRVQ